MKKIKEVQVPCYVTVYKAKRIKCLFKGSVQEYAMMWLHLTNNAREFYKNFLEVSNNHLNNVWVTCNADNDSVSKMKEYLEGIGLEIESIEDCEALEPVIYTDDPKHTCENMDVTQMFMEARYDWE